MVCAWFLANAEIRVRAQIQNRTTYKTCDSTGGSRVSESGKCEKRQFVCGLPSCTLQSNVSNDRWWAPNVNPPVLGVTRYPDSVIILGSSHNSMALYKPLFFFQQPSFSYRWLTMIERNPEPLGTVRQPSGRGPHTTTYPSRPALLLERTLLKGCPFLAQSCKSRQCGPCGGQIHTVSRLSST